MERKMTNLKHNGIPLQMSWLPIPKTELPARGIGIRTINSANQLSINGAVSGWCDELTRQILGQSFLSMEKYMAKMAELLLPKLELEEANTQLQAPETNVESSTDPLRVYQEKVEKNVKWDQSISDL